MTNRDPRRDFLKAFGAAGLAAAFGGGAVQGASPVNAPGSAPPPASPNPHPATGDSAPPPLTLNAAEYAFIEAAVDILIPADDLSPSGSQCGIAVFIDRQLAGAWGSGARLYRDGPFVKGKPEHGYQLPLTPREFFRAGIFAANGWTRQQYGRPFDGLPAALRAEALTAFEQGKAEFPGPGSREFFEALLAITMEGFFADPIYGGNRDKAGWKMVGYPGLPATYRDAIKAYHDKAFRQAPQSIADFS